MPEFKPFLIAWNLTKRCNLRCAHCYLSAGERDGGGLGELATRECFRVVDDLCGVNPAAILVLTGGEPLLRRDLAEIAGYATRKGMMVVVGTNGMLLTDERIGELKAAGVMGISISVDSLDSQKHDAFRCFPGALDGAMRGIDACRRKGLHFQIHTTASRMNEREIPAIMDFAYEKGARVFNLFFLVCTGRGEMMSDITPGQYESLLGFLVEAQPEYPGMLIRSRCAPHFKRVAYQTHPEIPITRAHGYEAGGCLAGTHYARITPDGDLTPCPFMPLSAGNLRKDRFVDLWERSPAFLDLREPKLKGKCGTCEFAVLCGGCRARPYASHGDYLDEDLWCLYAPESGERILPMPESQSQQLSWSPEARQRLERLPFFLQGMIRARAERHAADEGLSVITLRLLDNLRRKTFGNATPIFRDGRFEGLSTEEGTRNSADPID